MSLPANPSAQGDCAALLLAGGRGSRFGQTLPKQYVQLGGKPVLRWSLEALLAHPAVARVVTVIGEGDEADYARCISGLPPEQANKLAPPVTGGSTRQASVLNGLAALAQPTPPERVLIHDAARPGLTVAVIDRVIDALATHPGATPALPVHDSLRRAERSGTCTALHEAVARDGLYRVQTPQGFRFAHILAAHRAAREGHSDDATVLMEAGGTVAVVAGDEALAKLTLADDMERVMPSQPSRTAVGTGFDVHRFGTNSDGSTDHVWLCGVKVPHSTGLAGHSDADVGLHALVDAALGAIGAGDIGEHFPPSDARWRGAASSVFAEHAAGLITARGGTVSNIDITLICERPRIGPFKADMRAQVALLFGIATDQVNIKATTTEGLGFTGRGEGIAAQAAIAVVLPTG